MSSPSMKAHDRGRGQGNSAHSHGIPGPSPNMLPVLSNVKVDMNVHAGRGKQGKRRPGSMTRSLRSQTSVESAPDPSLTGMDMNVNAGRGKQGTTRAGSMTRSLRSQTSVESEPDSSQMRMDMNVNASRGKQWQRRPGSMTPPSLRSQTSVESEPDSTQMRVDMNVNASRGKQWKRRPDSMTAPSLKSQTSVDSTADPSQAGQFVDIEEQYLHAAEFGDIHKVKRLVDNYKDLNVDCIDSLGRTALRLAIKNEHLEVVEFLLKSSDQHQICEAALQAISAGHTQIAETILKHRRYLEMWKDRCKLGDTDGFYKTALPDSQFSSDITPLILASQKNQYEIVQLLLLRGETIQKPHKSSCGCMECRNRMKFDQLRLAKFRLNAYRGLASDAYISLSSEDPILTAFELAAELRRISNVEKHFKRDYHDLADQLSDFVVKLLDRIRTQKELELILNKTGTDDQEKYSSLARFKLALQYEEKKFVAHPSCQQRVVRIWYNDMAKLEHATWPSLLVMTTLFIAAFPFLVFLHIFLPNSKGAKILQFPVVKFLSHTMSFVAFLILVVVSTAESSETVSRNRTLYTVYSKEHDLYNQFRTKTNNTVFGAKFPLRRDAPSITDIILSLFIVGMICQESNQLFQYGFQEHISNLYNLQDFFLLSVYTATFTLKFWTMFKFHQSLNYLRGGDFRDEHLTLKHLYWLNADRMFWTPQDPINLAEGQFAIANILSFFRITYLLPASEILGPLQISLGRMLKDIGKFLALFVLVLLAFIVGLYNLFWYYGKRENIELNLPGGPDNFQAKAGVSFGGAIATFRTVFWSLFGRGEPDAVTLGDYKNDFTQDIGYIIYGAYNMLMVTVLLNMLIAMMTRSFTLIAEDSDGQWKFARSLLFMDYMSTESTLPVPLNVIGGFKSCLLWLVHKRGTYRSPEADDDNEGQAEKSPVQFEPRQPGRVKRSLSDSDPSESSFSVGKPNSSKVYIMGDLSSDDNASEMKRQESRGRVNAGFEGTPIKSKPIRSAATMLTVETEEKLTYQKTMQRIVQRYIFDIQREAEVTEDDFEEIKQDISSFRYDMINQMNSKQMVEEDLNTSMVAVMEQLENLKQRLLPVIQVDKIKGKTIARGEERQASYSTDAGANKIDGSQDIIENKGYHQQHLVDQHVDQQDGQKIDQHDDQRDHQQIDPLHEQQVDQQVFQYDDQQDDRQVDQHDDRQVDQQVGQSIDQYDDQQDDWQVDQQDDRQVDQHDDLTGELISRMGGRDDQQGDQQDDQQDDQQNEQQDDQDQHQHSAL